MRALASVLQHRPEPAVLSARVLLNAMLEALRVDRASLVRLAARHRPAEAELIALIGERHRHDVLDLVGGIRAEERRT